VIVITEFMDEAAVARMRAAGTVVYDPALADDQARIPGQIAGARALVVRNRTRVTADLLEAAPALQCVGRLGVGLDNIDMAACKARGVTVYPALGANNLSVAEYVITSAMALLRNAYQARAAMLAGDWPRQACAGRELSGKTLGLVGFGGIARDTADRARALGMTVAGFDPFLAPDDPRWGDATPMDLPGLLAAADVLSLHVPLTDDTRHMVNADTLTAMKPVAVVINAARGGVVDEDALCDALRAGAIAGAALDVFETEPLTAQAAGKFRDINNLILTPHIAGVTEESNERVSDMIADLVLKHLEKGPDHADRA